MNYIYYKNKKVLFTGHTEFKKYLFLVRHINNAENIIRLFYVPKYLFIIFKYRWFHEFPIFKNFWKII